MRGQARKAFDLTVARQHGVFTRRQALAAGYPRSTVDSKLRTGEWVSLHPGIHSHRALPPSWQRDQMAAVLWAHPGATGGRAAAFLHRLPGFEQVGLEVVTTNRRLSPRCGIIVHHTRWLPEDQVMRLQNIPCTSIERTLLDVCGLAGRRRGAIAVDHALHLGRVTLGSLDHCLYLTARRGRNGCGILREIVHERQGLGEFPNSGLETVIFEMIAGAGLPLPALQQPIVDPRGGFAGRPDFLYPDEKLVIEGHSRLWHVGTAVERADAARHERLTALGYHVLYVGWADATTFAEGTVERIRMLLAERRRFSVAGPSGAEHRTRAERDRGNLSERGPSYEIFRGSRRR